mgnify:CR=1 FL=1
MYHMILFKDELSCLDMCYLSEDRALMKFLRSIPEYSYYLRLEN